MRHVKWVRVFLVMALLVPQASLFAPVAAVADSPATTRPLVAVHVSEYTKALHGTPQAPGSSSDVLGMYYDSFSHAQAYNMLEDALRGDGTPFVEVTDADIAGGALLVGGVPAYPIVFSLMAEAVSDAEVTALRDYVSAGGRVYVGGSSWIRRPDGTFREDANGNAEFALSAEMGLKSLAIDPKPQGGMWGWSQATTIRRVSDDKMVSHLTAGQDLVWPLPNKFNTDAADGYVVGEGAHPVWATRVASQNPATVLAKIPQLYHENVTDVPLIATKQYGAGTFIFHAEMAPLAGYGGFAPDTSEYVFIREAIESAFRSARVPLVRLAAWRYQYNAALQTRWDCDFYDNGMLALSAVENPYRALGLRGQYHVVTSLVDDNAGIVRTLQSRDAVLASHSDQHVGPDLQTASEGANNIATSLGKLEGWTGVRPTDWVAPAYRGILDSSFALVEQAGIETAGEQNFGPFPHFTLSMTRPGEHYDVLQLPTSEWLPSSTDNPDARSRMELIPEEQISDVVDFYYGLGSLINLYGHPYYSNADRLATLLSRAASKGDVWFTHASAIYDWWKLRNAISFMPSTSAVEERVAVTIALAGASDPDTAIDVVPAGLDPTAVTDVRVTLDGSPAADWRMTARGLKVRVGTASTAVVSWVPLGADTTPPAAPTSVVATDTGTGGSVRLTWTNPTVDFAYSRIYRSTSAGTLGSRIADSLTAATYTNTGLTDNTTYYYTVRAVDAAGNESTNTAQSAATPTSPPPDTTPPAAPTSVVATDTGTGGSVRLTWTNPAVDFAYSRIYRSTSAGTLGSRIADSLTAATYTNTGLTDNTTYYYTVRAVDAAGNESTNTAQSAATPTSPPVGTQNMALKFDGVDDMLTVPYAASLNTTGALTVEAWVYVNTFRSQPIIASRWDGTQLSWDLYYSDDGRVRFYVRTPGGNGYVQAATAMSTLRSGGWRHVVGVLDPGAAQLRIYVDGALAATQAYTSGSANSSTSRLFINGAVPGTGATGFGDNTIDEVRVSSSVRYTGTSFTPSPVFVPDTSTVGLWHLNEGTGTVALDSGVNRNNATMTGAPVWVVGQGGGTPPPPDTTPPAAPTSVVATDTGTGGSVRLTWTNPTVDFAYSRIYRSTSAGTLGSRIADSLTAATYTNTGLTDNTTYYYTVRAVDAAGNESTNTAQSPATPTSPPPDTTPPAAPTSVVATDTGTGGSVRLTWTNPTVDFAYSRIYRSTSAGTLGSRIADSLTAATYTNTGLTDNTTYYYTVRAVDAAGNESTNTAQSAATPTSPPPDTTPPAAPTSVVATDTGTGGSVRLTWTNPTVDFAYSRIYRSTSAGTLGSRIADSLTASTYTNTGLTDNTTYYYTVRAVDAAGNESTNTAQSAATPTSPPPDTTPPAAPTSVVATDTGTGGSVRLTWTNPTVDFAYSRIYRSTSAGTLGSRIADSLTAATYTNTGLTDNTTYYYTVRAVDAAGNESTNTAQSAATPTSPPVGTQNMALKFDGVDDMLTVPYAASLNTTGALTVEAWVYVNTFRSQPIIASRWDGTQLSWDLYYSDDGRVRFYVRTPGGNGYVQATTGMKTLTPGGWRHVVGVLDPGAAQLRIYVDGALAATQAYTSGSANSSTSRLFINGAVPGTGATGFGDNTIDEVRVSSSVRYTGTSFTPSPVFVPDTSTVGLWHLNEGTGTVALDSGVNRNNATMTGAPVWVLR